MTKFKALFERALTSDGRAYIVTFITSNAKAVEELRNIDVTEFQTVEVSKFREKRSLNANAYFHVLCEKIAEKQNLSLEAVKYTLVLDYGTPLEDEEGQKVFIRLPKSVAPTQFHVYCKWIGDSKDTKKPCCDYLVMKQTHTLNTKEMARLVNGAIYEAQELGIETKTPNQIAEMMSLWGKEE